MGSANVDVRVEIDEAALRKAATQSEGVKKILTDEANKIINRANSLSHGMRTGIYHDHATGETRGDTEPQFDGDIQKRGSSYIGIVYTANYAAQKANLENNILLKAKG